MRKAFVLTCILGYAAIGSLFFVTPHILWGLVLLAPYSFIGAYDMLQKKQAIKRNFPVFGRGRYILEELGPKMYQYFVESGNEGTPINKNLRSVVYQRAKNVRDTQPFGTQRDTYKSGYEWLDHSMYPLDFKLLDKNPRVRVGGQKCTKPYESSILNISAMSYGSLSKNAIMALNGGAAKGGFAHNTGEGSISPFHEQPGGDLIWQIGTGYFGCRTKEGDFDPDKFAEKAGRDQVKMIEIKMSQGAKPGHGGILPADKNTEEIAAIRGVEPGTRVVSPPFHKAFSNPTEMLEFIDRLRDLSGGKPVGIKMCIGKKEEFIELVQEMQATQRMPDFITIDGAEGGTGAAPPEYANSVGTPLREGLAFAHDVLQGFGIRDQIKIIASGKMITGFHMVRAFALGADMCNMARAMMLALGCIQALECNKNTCPTGIATQDPQFMVGLDVQDKTQRIANFHENTVHNAVDLLSSAGFSKPNEVGRHHINRRISMSRVSRYDEIYPDVKDGSFLDRAKWPHRYMKELKGVLDNSKFTELS